MSGKSFLRKLIRSFLFCISLAFTIQIFADLAPPTGDRVKDNPIIDSQAGRCHKVPVAAEQCNKQREQALKVRCINQQEYSTLVRINAYPLCDFDYSLLAHCSCGCFEESTRIFSFENSSNEVGYKPISRIISEKNKFSVASVKPNSTLTNLNIGLYNLLSTTSGPEEKPLVVFKTINNLRLAVTSEHAILLANGKMVAAKNVKMSDQLVLANGSPIELKSIESLKTNKNVLNLLTTGESNIEHTVFAEGLIVGDLAWQNNLKSMLNAIAIRQ
ncbi:Hint domain-containing protein [Fluviispira multicolorata]|uniref:Hint domain-containing protein n=1 Tax=Fluviispira multicolorata TaxID=2654512 RepID=A0A833JAI9_9BACT|nr:Hint domain-containing protein [Fluviispira multicolorata]KAB8028084.1 hypothetical protein GCL57_13615 [Fluviispira multicolorata]